MNGWACKAAVYPAAAALAALIASSDDAAAASRRGQPTAEAEAPRPAGDPVLAIVSLRDQRITIYDANGWIVRAPVSSGQKGRETPAGIFSVIQKDADHHSNLYDDAFMPHMQRLTWSGIALHGGPLPGYAASHGCVRMPFDFAERLFDMTQMGLRVIVAPTDVAPVEIAHPALPKSKPGDAALVAARAAEAEEAGRKAEQARQAAGVAFRESVQAMVPVRVAENLKIRADTQLAAAETALGSATSPEAKEQAERARAQAADKAAELQAQRDAAKAALQPKLDAVTGAREAAAAAETARVAAVAASRQLAHEREPVSVLISRKTQKLYVRQGFEPIMEGPVTIADADRPIGTHVFTALERTDGEAGLRWNVVSLESGRSHGDGAGSRSRPGQAHGRDAEPAHADLDGARSALDRIVIPQDVLGRITAIAPRSSLIITDEAQSPETGKGTDFVVILSDEPQGGIKIRRREPDLETEVRYTPQRERMFYGRSPFGARFSTW